MLGENKAVLRGDIVALITFSGRLDVARKKNAAAIAMELEFLDALGQRAEMAEQPVFLLAGPVQGFVGFAAEQAVTQRAKESQTHQAEQDVPRKPAKIRGPAEE